MRQRGASPCTWLPMTPSIESAARAMTTLHARSDGGLIATDELQECVTDWSTESATASGALYLPLPPNDQRR
jgi:hypothetical protein